MASRLWWQPLYKYKSWLPMRPLQPQRRERSFARQANSTVEELLREIEELKEANASLRSEKRTLDSSLIVERNHAAQAQAVADSIKAEYSTTTASLCQRLHDAQVEQQRLSGLVEGKAAAQPMLSSRGAITPLAPLASQPSATAPMDAHAGAGAALDSPPRGVSATRSSFFMNPPSLGA